MIVALLICILLLLCRPLRVFVGAIVAYIVGALMSQHFFGASQQTAVIVGLVTVGLYIWGRTNEATSKRRRAQRETAEAVAEGIRLARDGRR